jgi:hypothetical protein
MQTILQYAQLLVELSGAVALTCTALSKLVSLKWPRAGAFLAGLGHDIGAAKDAIQKKASE